MDDYSTATEKTPNRDGHGTSSTFRTGTAAAASPHPSQRSSLNRDASGSRSRFIVVMGVSGTGKSTLGVALSKALHLPFIDGDDLHPAANVAKMSRGDPLDDADRQPWLDTIRKTAVACVLDQLGEVEPATKSMTEGMALTEYESSMVRRGPSCEERRRSGVIIACSSLKKTYRAALRGEGSTSDAFPLPTYFVYLKGDRDVLMARMQNRKGHFMKAGMLESQLNALESPEDEPGVVTVSVEMSTEEQVRRVIEMFRSQGR